MKTAHTNKRRVMFYIDALLKEQVEERAKKTGQPQSYIVTQALQKYLPAKKGGD
jgi:predicted transcriptional regulator